MSIHINRDELKKLTHESSEIRLRTLEQVDGKISRALAHNQIIEFRSGELCKQLIRWFGYQPLQASGKVLQLLGRILRSKYGADAVQQLGLERFKREMSKVQELVKGRFDELQIIDEIQTTLRQQTKKDVIENEDDIIDLLNLMEIAGDAGNASTEPDRIICLSADYEMAWSKANIADFNSMKLIAEILVNPCASSVELQNALQHLQITLPDYPAEYLLQAPNIYLNLLELFERAGALKCPLDDVCLTLLEVLKLLKQRLHVRRKCIAFEAPKRESQTLARTQLKLDKALDLLLQKILKHLQIVILEIGNETTQLMELLLSALEIYKIQQFCVEITTIQRLYNILRKLREACNQDEHFTLQRIKYLLFSFLLQDMAQNDVNRHIAEILLPLLRDYPIRVNFPQRHKRLTQLLCRDNSVLKKREENIKNYEKLFGTAMSLLKEPKSLKNTDIIAQGVDICFGAVKLKSLQLIELLFNAIVDCNPIYPANSNLQIQSTQLLLQLLQLSHEPFKTYVYNKLASIVKKHFACLMNGESYCAAITNSKLLACQIIGVPLSTTLLHQFIHDSQNATDVLTQKHCIDLLYMLLKSKHLLADQWPTFLEILLPALPLLQACTQSSKLTLLLLKLYDPDAENLPFLATLQGNIGFLFHPDTAVRNEAITRLIYVLNSLETANLYLPNIMEINDLIPSDLCYMQPPRDLACIFAHNEMFSDLSTLHNLLNLLGSADIEPLIRKTALMQLNVICQSWEMTVAFCKESAHYLILHALENSLQKESFDNYADAAIPAIGILCKVLCYDFECRQQLTNTPNIYVLLLRALILYQHDIQVRQDASICLMQLLYSNYMVVPDGNYVQLPLILTNMHLPVRCKFLNQIQLFDSIGNAFVDIFDNSNEETIFLRFVLAFSYCEGQQLTSKYMHAQKELDFCSTLHLTTCDWRLWKATVPLQNLKRFLKCIANTTEHRTLINTVTYFKWQIQLHAFEFVEDVPANIDTELFELLSKYLHLPPGNEIDFILYERLLELIMQCVRLPMPAVIVGIRQALYTDYQHAFLLLLKRTELPLRLFNKICGLLTLILHSNEESSTMSNLFFRFLFETVFIEVHELFQRRDLQRVRCLLTLLRACSVHYWSMPDQLLMYYCKRFLNLSIAIKAFSQTGAQWQRDCLLQICQLHAKMKEPELNFKLVNVNCLRYLSGLCGHNDAEVRIMSWRILTYITQFNNAELNGATILIDELSYLPGGFLACCLSTLLDNGEMVRVRQIAGELFAALLSNSNEAYTLLEQHAFFPTAQESLCACYFDIMLPQNFDFETAATTTYFITCELVTVYCCICIRLLRIQSDFVQTLCEKPFMCKLYELLKLPPSYDNPAYYIMCANICKLYSLCCEHNFAFLQRTLCRDQIWLMSFCELLHQSEAEESHVVNVLQLLIILSKDVIAYEKLCEKFTKVPEVIVQLFMRALDVSHFKSQLQQTTLAALIVLLSNSQTDLKSAQKTFGDILEQKIYMTPRDPQHVTNKGNEISTNGKKNNSSTTNDQNCQSQLPTKHREPTNVPLKFRILRERRAPLARSPEKIATSPSANKIQPVAFYIFHDLFRLFNHMYTTESCKFETAPNACKIQINEALGALLHVSQHAQESAQQLKLFGRILGIFQTFFHEFSTSTTTFVRRYGETRKMAIIKNFQVLLKVFLNWYSSPNALITNELHANELTKMLIQIWPWLAYSGDLKLNMLQLCNAVSKRSTIVCQKFSVIFSSYANSVLQLIMKIVVFETTKVKAASTEDFPIVQSGIDVLINSCACAEGRASLLKERILDTFDGLYPFNPKSPKLKSNILHAWLQFWEIFSRHADGAKLRNLSALCSIVLRLPVRSITRLYALRILRNMCCLASNRTQLMGSKEFLIIIYNVLAQSTEIESVYNSCCSYEEQMIVTVAILELISGGIKYVAMIRGSKLEKKFRILREHLQTQMDENADQIKRCEHATALTEMLDTLLKRFDSI